MAGRASNVALGGSFEDVVEAALNCPHGCFARGHPATKVIRGKVIHTAKNGVDFVGSWRGRAVALEAKRLPKATSVRASKDDSTQAEARFLLNFQQSWSLAHMPAAAFLIHDPLRSLVYVVHDRRDLTTVAGGGFVSLTKGEGSVWSFTATPTSLLTTVRAVLDAL